MKQQFLSKVYQHPLLKPEELQKIVDAHQNVNFKKGDFLLQENEIADSYFILASGLIRSFVFNYEGKDITTDFFAKGELVIEVLSLFQQTKSQENIQALTDCVCWRIDFGDFQELYHAIPGFSEWGRLWMTGRLFHFKQRSVEMITNSAKERYLHLMKAHPEVVLQAPLKHIASYLGITDTSFSRIRKEIS